MTIIFISRKTNKHAHLGIIQCAYNDQSSYINYQPTAEASGAAPVCHNTTYKSSSKTRSRYAYLGGNDGLIKKA